MRTIGNAGSSARRVEAIASGTMSTGDTVVVNADGTVSSCAETVIPSSAGTPVVFETALTTNTGITYDTANNKVVVAYRDGGNSGYLTAVVGTVSGSSISFGTPVVAVATNSNSPVDAVYDSANGKVVVCYRDVSDSDRPKAVVGTVSGTSISFGSPTTITTSQVGRGTMTYDSINSKVVFMYKDDNNSNYGTAAVGTVSGTSISFGTPVVFESAFADYFASTFDSTNGKVIVDYEDNRFSARGVVRVGTVSGTSISFGGVNVYNNAPTASHDVTYDPVNQKLVVAYFNSGVAAPRIGYARVGTISGTSVSFGTGATFASASSVILLSYNAAAGKIVVNYSDTNLSSSGYFNVGTISGTDISFGTAVEYESGTTSWPSLTYDPDSGQNVVAYRDEGNSDYGTAAMIQPTYTAINLTAENFIGFADYGVPDGQAVVVNTRGAIAENQSGLTAGQKYYVQTDGTLSTTAGDPSVEAGTAVAADKIIVKG